MKVIAITGDEESLLAEFELVGDTVSATYHDELFQDHVESGLVWTEATGAVRPSDGRRFLDALRLSFSNSSTIVIR